MNRVYLFLLILSFYTFAVPVLAERRYQKPDSYEIKKRLSPLQFQVTQEEATERPFDNEYWDNKRAGIYVDVASGEPLFS